MTDEAIIGTTFGCDISDVRDMRYQQSKETRERFPVWISDGNAYTVTGISQRPADGPEGYEWERHPDQGIAGPQRRILWVSRVKEVTGRVRAVSRWPDPPQKLPPHGAWSWGIPSLGKYLRKEDGFDYATEVEFTTPEQLDRARNELASARYARIIEPKPVEPPPMPAAPAPAEPRDEWRDMFDDFGRECALAGMSDADIFVALRLGLAAYKAARGIGVRFPHDSGKEGR